MEKVVIFDWGGVVESHEGNRYELKQGKARVIKKLGSPLSLEEITLKWPNEISTGISIESTNKDEDIKDWLNIIQRDMEITVTKEEFQKLYDEKLSSVKYYKEVVEYAHSLKGKCKIAILSNLPSFDRKRIDDQYDLSKFDYVYLSYEIGMIKPDKRIYQYVLNDLNVNPWDILFIDDREDNILMAKRCGWNTCQAFGYELDKIKKSVEEFLN